ncbi:DUF5709 domain-containing protein [Nocardioides daeguensis]|uniref:DUF5709 domain-containing protein n=1 Tax=Nocardioides daeguensis TaxID=908359 RepID=A0ABP6W238_9ACTN|nr:DUF5709 domain-containing protein [Nocardioides daeguensis]MBV6727690.1 hypothetical protein [Nocardioides daeguensis]MCR1775162.1 hypothetical protein [Nocardioides daeguensis]
MTTNDPTDETTPDPEQYDGYSVDDETQLQPEDTLLDDGVEDELDRGYSPPERYSAAQRYGNTAWEQAHDQPLDDRLAEEEPEPDPIAEADRAEAADDGLAHEADEPGTEVGDDRAGRLVDPDQGLGDDLEPDLVAEDVGIDGAAAGAEEAAMHVITDDAADDAEE